MPSAESLALLQELCTIPATAGDEQLLSDWILRYTLKHQSSWKHQPEIFAGDGFQEAIVLMFGRPRLAVFAHLDTVGYCTAYGDRLVPIGKPKAKTGATLLGRDAKGPVAKRLGCSGVRAVPPNLLGLPAPAPLPRWTLSADCSVIRDASNSSGT